MAQREPIRVVPSDIPDKLYFRIGEVSRLCEVPAYVLRFWETEFSLLRPNKGGTGQRLYRRRDVETALRIKRLLYDEGYTIPGARQILKSETKQKAPQLTLAIGPPLAPNARPTLEMIKAELGSLLALLGEHGSSSTVPALRNIKPARHRADPAPRLAPVAAVSPLFDAPVPLRPTIDLGPQRHSAPASEAEEH